MYEDVPAWRASELVARGAQLVDVREAHEFAAGSHPDAVSIPLSQLSHRLGELRRDRPVALLCRTGNRSGQAAALLAERGFPSVLNLAGGVESLLVRGG